MSSSDDSSDDSSDHGDDVLAGDSVGESPEESQIIQANEGTSTGGLAVAGAAGTSAIIIGGMSVHMARQNF